MADAASMVADEATPNASIQRRMPRAQNLENGAGSALTRDPIGSIVRAVDRMKTRPLPKKETRCR